ncbi:MAG: nitrile hydratase accessory protein [Pseudomonadota bacterium]
MKTPLLPGQPSDVDGPVFNAPWEAKTFAMVVHLHQRGLFDWSEWAQLLSREIHSAGGGEVDDGEHYYRHWQSALEKLLKSKSIASVD